MQQKSKKEKLPPFVAIPKEMLKSPAWLALGNAARVAYIHIKAKAFSRNLEDLPLSYKEMEPIMERRTYSWALKELEEFGFIEKVQRGGLYRRRNFFKLIDDWRKKTTTDIDLGKARLKKAKEEMKKRKDSRGTNDTVDSGTNDTVNIEFDD